MALDLPPEWYAEQEHRMDCFCRHILKHWSLEDRRTWLNKQKDPEQWKTRLQRVHAEIRASSATTAQARASVAAAR